MLYEGFLCLLNLKKHTAKKVLIIVQNKKHKTIYLKLRNLGRDKERRK